jgi:nucleoid-associated protein YgaU
MSGETLSDIAAELYRDPTQWRPIAIANGIADPLSIEPGQALRVPALPFSDPDSGEAVA